ncbi:MAG: hypothetical protein BGP22_34860 [Variovorax sp. 67-131]|nr:MAG: hypothetical protein ABS94_17785 [Variovorax sp. SCN 67-85]ODV17160.1 MAG: hypothetical protein ABT25_30105 [Variovorax sp. SCN 67-20]OJZ09387.1 MAG: hypothetical protein BGP22_34860 [Variovorax sp. 67-131]
MEDPLILSDRNDAYSLLRKLGASTRLLLHLQLVGEAADELIHALSSMGLAFDAKLVELGVAVHDAGKIEHPAELDGPGSQHEPSGERLLLTHHVQPKVARCCVSHAAWSAPGVCFEERLVALADKLWKGKREQALELCVIDEVATRLHLDRWDVFPKLDLIFEDIASGGEMRLQKSRLI